MSPQSNITFTSVFFFLFSTKLWSLVTCAKEKECQHTEHLESLSLANVMLLYVYVFLPFSLPSRPLLVLKFEKWHFNFLQFVILPMENMDLYILFQRLSTNEKWPGVHSLLVGPLVPKA